MNISRRAFKDPERYAHFTPDGNRLLVCSRYIYAFEVPSLRLIYRVRPLPGMGKLVMQANGEHMLVPYGHGQFALLAVANGEVLATCGDGSSTELRQYALSLCGTYMIQIRSQKDIRVREISSNRVVWERSGHYGSAAPFGESGDWALFFQNRVEVWRWPFADNPERVFELGCQPFWPDVRGTLAAIDSYERMPVIDLVDGRTLFTATGTSLTHPYIRREGSVVVAQRDQLLLYSSTGELLRKVRAPRIARYGHAFSPARDDAALAFHEGLVFIRDFDELIYSHEEIDAALPIIKQNAPGSYDDYAYATEPPSGCRCVEASTREELQRALFDFRRPAWKPVLKAEASAAESSKFGGVPWLARDEDWPQCGQCGVFLDLLLQLNSADLPTNCPKLFEGLLQVFLCSTETYSGGLCQSSHPFSDAALARVVQPDGPSSVIELADEDLFQEMHIVGWSSAEDYPDGHDLRLVGIELSDEQEDLQREAESCFPLEGDKLFGWPAWQQGVERVACTECNGPMREIFQIESLDAVPLMFGDSGRGWISQCPAHPHVVCFSWTCG